MDERAVVKVGGKSAGWFHDFSFFTCQASLSGTSVVFDPLLFDEVAVSNKHADITLQVS